MGGRESFCLRDLYHERGISVENENERSSNEREWTRGDEEEINFLAGGRSCLRGEGVVGVICIGNGR